MFLMSRTSTGLCSDHLYGSDIRLWLFLVKLQVTFNNALLLKFSMNLLFENIMVTLIILHAVVLISEKLKTTGSLARHVSSLVLFYYTSKDQLFLDSQSF